MWASATTDLFGLEGLERRARAPSFFVSGALACALAGSLLEHPVWRWSAVALLLAALAVPGARRTAAGALFFAWLGLAGWWAAHALWLSPAWHAEALYHAGLLGLPFLAAASMGEAALARLFRLGLALMAALVALGLLQHFAGVLHLPHNPQRAAAVFYTPNTFAAAINLFLLPLAALYLGHGDRRLLLPAGWLFLGLLLTQSRGGYLGLGAGLVFLAWWYGRGVSARRWLELALPAAALAGALALLAGLGISNWSAGRLAATLTGGHSSGRLEIYGVAWALVREQPWLGVGPFNFHYLFEANKVAPYLERTVNFVHSDWLQVWLELGLPGLLLWLATLAALSAGLSRLRRRAGARDSATAAMAGAAVAGFAAHSAVDFPLYVPATGMLLALWLGAAHAALGTAARARPFGRLARLWQRPGLRVAVLGGAAVWLALPVGAATCAETGLAALARGQATAGARWTDAALLLEPRNPQWHWRAGVIARERALESGDPELARRADERFRAGAASHPWEVANLQERLRLHRDHRGLLTDPAPPAELLDWARRAVRLAPHSPQIVFDHARTLAFAGQPEQALEVARGLARDHAQRPELAQFMQETAQRLARGED